MNLLILKINKIYLIFSFCVDRFIIWRPPSVSKLTQIMFYLELKHLDSEASISCLFTLQKCSC